MYTGKLLSPPEVPVKPFRPAILVVATALLSVAGHSQTPTPAPQAPRMLMPPSPPRHEQRMVDSASDLARDLTEVVAFLEQGQAYFRAYKKGSHTTEENAAMLRFLETYEQERELAKKEAKLLNSWVQERSDLEPVEDKLKKSP